MGLLVFTSIKSTALYELPYIHLCMTTISIYIGCQLEKSHKSDSLTAQQTHLTMRKPLRNQDIRIYE